MESDKLKRTIGLASATSIGLGAMLGAGIFVFPGLAGGDAGFAAIFSFLIGGFIALIVAACTAELATAMPQSGGGYYFISRSFGPFWGSIVGIAQWVGLIFACAFYLISFGEYVLSFLAELGLNWTTGKSVWAFCFTFLLLLVNILGTKKVGRFQNMMVISLTVMLVLIFTYGIVDYFGLSGHAVAFTETVPQGLSSIFSTTALIFTSYLGFVQIANIGAEIKQPNYNLPRSLIGSVAIAALLYAFIMFACISTFSQEQLSQFGETATVEVARNMLGNWGAIVVVFAALLAALSSANASVISASRSVFALSNDDLITHRASKVNKRFGTPHIALILVTLPVAVMLIRSRLEVFAEVASFLHLIIYAGICLTILKLRRTNPVWYIPSFRVPLVKITAGVGAISCLALIFFMQKTSILLGLGVMLATVLYYFFFLRKKEISLSDPNPPHIAVDLLRPSVLIPVDITKEEKDLPDTILQAVPMSETLLLGYQQTPEQSEAEQSEDEFGAEGKEKLAPLIERLEKSEVHFDTELIFSNKVANQIEQVIKEEELRFILKPKPVSRIKRLTIPIHDASQINTELGTVIYKLYKDHPTKIRVALLTNDAEQEDSNLQWRQAIESQLRLVNLQAQDLEQEEYPDMSLKEFLREEPKDTDLIVWSEASEGGRELLMDIILEKESLDIVAPILFILRK
ncbi:MAG TPA: APC family permease [Saprospiraceae bacterium]|nr:APC family permease [Saprospiraceae bacterium]